MAATQQPSPNPAVDQTASPTVAARAPGQWRGPASFDVRISGGGNRSETVIGINGELNATLARILGRTLDRLDPATVDRVVLDLARVSDIDAAGWRLIRSLRQRCRRAGHELEIRRDSFTRPASG